MAYTYSTYVEALANTLVIEATNANFLTELPSIINYAEQRIYRELDLLSTRVVDDTGQNAQNSRYFTLPSTAGRFAVVESIAIYTPAGSRTTRHLLIPVSVDYINMAWPTDTAATAFEAVPEVYAMLTDQLVILGPPSGNGFYLEVIGTIRPTALSFPNSSTYLTAFLPDLFFAASMVFASGYQKNFGSQADDPKMAQSWEGQYQALLKSANAEEERKRFGAASWTSKKVEETAVPQRG